MIEKLNSEQIKEICKLQHKIVVAKLMIQKMPIGYTNNNVGELERDMKIRSIAEECTEEMTNLINKYGKDIIENTFTDKEYLQKYLNYLKLGGSMMPLDALKTIDLDFSNNNIRTYFDTYTTADKKMSEVFSEIKNKKKRIAEIEGVITDIQERELEAELDSENKPEVDTQLLQKYLDKLRLKRRLESYDYLSYKI